MKNLKLSVIERMFLLRAIPQSGPLNQVAVYLRIIEALRIKEDEQKEAGWHPADDGMVTVEKATLEFDVALEDADFATLAQLAAQWDGWPTAPQSLVLKSKLDAAS